MQQSTMIVAYEQFKKDLLAGMKSATVPYTFIKTGRGGSAHKKRKSKVGGTREVPTYEIHASLPKDDVVKHLQEFKTSLGIIKTRLQGEKSLDLKSISDNIELLKVRAQSMNAHMTHLISEFGPHAKLELARNEQLSLTQLPDSILRKIFTSTRGVVTSNLATTCRVMYDIGRSTITRSAIDTIIPHLGKFLYHVCGENPRGGYFYNEIYLHAVIDNKEVATCVTFSDEGDQDDSEDYDYNDEDEDNNDEDEEPRREHGIKYHIDKFTNITIKIGNKQPKTITYGDPGNETYAEVYAKRFPSSVVGVPWIKRVMTGQAVTKVPHVEYGMAFAAAEYILTNNALSPLSAWYGDPTYETNDYGWGETENYAWLFYKNDNIDNYVEMWNSLKKLASVEASTPKDKLLAQLRTEFNKFPEPVINKILNNPTKQRSMEEVPDYEIKTAKHFKSVLESISEKGKQWLQIQEELVDLHLDLSHMIEAYRYDAWQSLLPQ